VTNKTLQLSLIVGLSFFSIEEVLEEQKRKNKQRVALIFDDVLGKMHFKNSSASCASFEDPIGALFYV